MTEQIDNIIFNRLLAGCDVYLPEVGSLIVRDIPARLVSPKLLAAPHREILFSPEKRGVSLVDAIAATADIPAERASAFYGRWLRLARRDGGAVIGPVGEVREGKFVPCADFAAALNPAGAQELTLRPRRRPAVIAAIAVLVAIVAFLLFCAISVFINPLPQPLPQPLPRLEEPAATAVVEQVAETPAESVAEQPAETLSKTPAETLTETLSKTPAEQPSDEVLQMREGYSYAVWGVYRELENARLYSERLAGRYGTELDVRIFGYRGGRFMVAVGETPTREECNRLILKLRSRDSRFGELWIYTCGGK